MPDVALVQSGSNNGTATPATPGSLTTTAGNLLILVVAAIGTSPTISQPGGWSSASNNTGATLTTALFFLKNNPGGATNPSATLGGTVTGWVTAMFEFSQCGGASAGQQGAQFLAHASLAQLTNIFPASGQTLYNELFVYTVARATATMTPQNSFNSPLSVWSSSVQPQAGVQGISLDTFWASGLGQGVGQYPQASGLLSSGVASVQIAAWFSTNASQPGPNGDNIGGQAGILVGSNYQGMVGG